MSSLHWFFFFIIDCQAASPRFKSHLVEDPELARAAWHISKKITGLHNMDSNSNRMWPYSSVILEDVNIDASRMWPYSSRYWRMSISVSTDCDHILYNIGGYLYQSQHNVTIFFMILEDIYTNTNRLWPKILMLSVQTSAYDPILLDIGGY